MRLGIWQQPEDEGPCKSLYDEQTCKNFDQESKVRRLTNTYVHLYPHLTLVTKQYL